jgi:TATA-box binding protein (TBP) (component of TFIID and TFIIIB)
MNININFEVTNIKLSFLIPFSLNIKHIKIYKNIYKIYVKNHNSIIKGVFGTVTILGKNQNHINLTGIRKIETILNKVKIFCQTYNIVYETITNLKIDCISSVSDVRRGLKNQILNDQQINKFYKISNPPKFPGLILRTNNKISLSYFNSGKLIVIGTKCICQIQTSCELFDIFIRKIK